MSQQTSVLSAQRGFTLVEVILALTLFALLGTILYGAIALSHGAVEKSQVSSEKSQKLRSAVDLLGSYIRSSYPYRASQQDPSIFYTGEEAELSFVSAFSLTMGGRGMAKIHLFYETENGNDGVLKLEEQVPMRLGDESAAGGYKNEVVLREGISELRLGYLDPKSENGDWVDKWDGNERKALPRAVRLNFRDGEREVEWVFPVMMTVMAP